MINHHYMYPRVTELRQTRPAAPAAAPVRRPSSRASQRRLVEWSLLRVPETR